MTMNASSHSPETIIVEEARLFRLGAPAYFFRTYATGRACWLRRNIVTVLYT